MALNLNTSPYYDDFDATKNYNRILFKPGYAVQARELTQLQTILQDQIGQLGSFTLKNGAVISGCEEKIEPVPFIKITDTYYYQGSATSSSLLNSDLANYVDLEIQGQTTNIKANIVGKVESDGTGRPNIKAFYVNYTEYNNSTALHFSAGERLKVISEGTYKDTEFVVDNFTSSPRTLDNTYFGEATRIQLSPGIVFVNDQFVRTTKVATYISPFNNSVKRRIGFEVTESIKSYIEDDTLKDPASGSYNANAPGADRLNISVALKSYAANATLPDNFYEYARWEYGRIIRNKVKEDPLNRIGDSIAEQFYESQGNYVSRGLLVKLREHLNDGVNGGVFTAANGGDANKMIAEISPGVASVGGRLKELRERKLLEIPKPTDTVTQEDVTLTTAYGNYVIVDELSGVWDIDGGDKVDLRSAAAGAVTAGTYSSTSAGGSSIGTARVRHVVYSSGTPGAAACQYRIYLFDIRMNSTSEFKDVRGLYYNDATADAHADIVLESGNAVLKETDYNRLIFPLPATYVESIAPSGYDYEFQYTKEFDVSFDANATAQITVSSPNSFPYGTGSLSDTVVNANLLVVAKDTFTTVGGTTITAGEVIDMTSGTFSVTATGSVTLDFDLDDTIDTATYTSRGVKIYANVKVSNTQPIVKALNTDHFVKLKVDGTAGYGVSATEFCLGVPDVLKIKEIRSHSSAFTATTDGTDVTSQFRLDNGQKDNFYGLAKIIKKATSTVNFTTHPYLLVKFDYFTRSDEWPSFACADSYASPISAGDMKLQEIPLFTRSTGTVLDLRNYLDFRPYADTTATPVVAASLGSAPENPSSVLTLDRPTNGLSNPVPVQEFTTDVQSCLAQGFRIVLSVDGEFKYVAGPQDIKVMVPAVQNSRDMTIATFELKPKPSLSQASGKYYNRPDLATKVTQVENPKYTMRRIGALEQRIKNLEYYTSLSILEEQAKNEQFLDGSGVDRFKNGLLVEPFNSFAVADLSHPDYKCAIDKSDAYVRSYYSDDAIQFVPAFTGASTDARQTGKMFHVPFAEVVYAENLLASKYESIVTELLYDEETTPPITPEIPENPPEEDVAGSYSLQRSKSKVAEGGSIRISVSTTRVPSGTNITYRLSGSGITNSDLAIGTLTGDLTIGNGGGAYVDFTFVDNTSITADTTMTFLLAISDSVGNNTNDGVTGLSTTFTLSETPEENTKPIPVPPVVNGTMTIAPESDEWTDKDYIEPVYNDSTGSYTNFEYGDAYHREWRSWTQIDTGFTVTREPTANKVEHKQGKPWTESAHPNLFDHAGGYYEYAQVYETWDEIQAQELVTKNYTETGYDTWEYIYTGELPDSIVTFVGEDYVDEQYVPYTREQAIHVSVAGLAHNLQHTVYMGGKEKGTITTDHQGKGSTTIQVEKGEFPAGLIDIICAASDSHTVSNSSSVCHAQFASGGGTIKRYQMEYNRLNPPSTAIIPGNTKTRPLAGTNPETTLEPVGTPEVTNQDVKWNYFNFNSTAVDVITTLTVQELPNGSTTAGTVTGTGASLQTAIWETYGTTTEVDTEGFATYETTPLAYITGEVAGANNYNAGGSAPTVTNAADNVEINYDAIDALAAFEQSRAGAYALAGMYGGACGTIFDPMAQSFLVSGYEEGIFISGVDLFFHTISSEANNNGIVVEIREMINGYPGPKCVAKVRKDREACQASSYNASTGVYTPRGTTFNFGYPVFLEAGKEYCIVPIPERDDPDYRVWIAELGKKVHGTDTIISKQAHSGILFTSANNRTWTPRQKEDLMFRLKRCTFTPNTDYKVRLANAKHDWTKFSSFSDSSTRFAVGDVIHNFTFDWTGSSTGTFTSNPTSFTITDANQLASSNATGTLTMTGTISTVTNVGAADASRAAGTYTITSSDWTTTGSGTGAEFSITVDGSGAATITVTTAGTGFDAGDTITVADSNLGSGGAADLTFDVDELNSAITGMTLTNPGAGFNDKSSPTITFVGGTQSVAPSITVTTNIGVMLYWQDSYETHTIKVLKGRFYTTNNAKNTARTLVGNGTKTATTTTLYDRVVHAYALKLPEHNPGNQGTVTPKIALTNTGAGSVNTTLETVHPAKTITLDTEKTILSYSNEVETYGSGITDARGSQNATGLLEITLNTTQNHLSPVLNGETIVFGAFKNEINNPTNLREEVRAGGNSTTKYISRKVKLVSGQEAEDIKVLLDNKIPSSSADVKVFYKCKNIADDTADYLEDIFWREMDVEVYPFNTETTSWAEYTYKVPAKGSTSAGLNGSGILEYDVTGVSTFSVTAGGAGYNNVPAITISNLINLTGTWTASTSSTSVTATGGAATTELIAGDILKDTSGNVVGTISSITDDNTIVLTANATTAVSAGTIARDGDGYGATATATVAAGAVSGITIDNPGRGYDSGTILVTITPDAADTITSTATATATTATTTYTGFSEYSIKIVHLSSSAVSIPKSANLRAYALQA